MISRSAGHALLTVNERVSWFISKWIFRSNRKSLSRDKWTSQTMENLSAGEPFYWPISWLGRLSSFVFTFSIGSISLESNEKSSCQFVMTWTFLVRFLQTVRLTFLELSSFFRTGFQDYCCTGKMIHVVFFYAPLSHWNQSRDFIIVIANDNGSFR